MQAVLAAFVLAGANVQTPTPLDTFAQRALARALDDRCALFNEQERLALDGAYLQTRGSLLRQGYSAQTIDESYQQITRNAASQSCNAEATSNLAGIIRFAFAGWLRERTQTYVSAPGAWQATRPFAYDSWVISQGFAGPRLPMVFGIYNRNGEQSLAAAVHLDADVAAVRVRMRDPERVPSLYDPTLGGLLTINGAPEWTSYLPPQHGSHQFLASARIAAEDGIFFNFPSAALESLVELDPREAIEVLAFDASGNRIATRFIGVGDFAAALAFVRSSPDLSAGR
ncbi:hypothetical protein [Hyphobacterium sp.]|uniref:hypothetical protein n=1 Tax=Hyphobacterium sp. TaxID=2004662 RepID=UPI003BACCDA1